MFITEIITKERKGKIRLSKGKSNFSLLLKRFSMLEEGKINFTQTSILFVSLKATVRVND